MNARFHHNEAGELYEAAPMRQYVVDAKRQDAAEFRSKARQHRQWERDHSARADDYERLAERADSIADFWQTQVMK